MVREMVDEEVVDVGTEVSDKVCTPSSAFSTNPSGTLMELMKSKVGKEVAVPLDPLLSSVSGRVMVPFELLLLFSTTVGRVACVSISLTDGTSKLRSLIPTALGMTCAPFNSKGGLAVTGLRVTAWLSFKVNPLMMTLDPVPESSELPLRSRG